MIWELPVGSGKRYLSQRGPIDWVFGGWQLSATYSAQSGNFLTPQFSGTDPSNTQTFGGTPDRIGNGNLPTGQRTIDRWFDALAFVLPPNGRFGNSGRGIIQGPGYQVLNLGLFKSFHPTERTSLQFRVTFTNALNHPNFGDPNLNISTPGSVGTITSIQGREGAGPRSGLVGIFLRF